jgi:hypothetical protein
LRTHDTEVLNFVKGVREGEWRFVTATEILIIILCLTVMCSV